MAKKRRQTADPTPRRSKAGKAKQCSVGQPDDDGERISMAAFDKLLAKRMEEKGIPYETATENIESGELYTGRAHGKSRRERSLNGWLDAKEDRDWARACGVESEYDNWS